MNPEETAAIWWVRRDLRLTDNQALAAALAAAPHVLPAFVLDPRLLNSRYNCPRRTAFLFDGLRALDAALQARGGRLIVRSGDPGEALARLMGEIGAEMIVAEQDYSPYSVARDSRLARSLPLVLTPGVVVQAPGDVVRQAGGTYTVVGNVIRAKRRVGALACQETASSDTPAYMHVGGREPAFFDRNQHGHSEVSSGRVFAGKC